MAKKPTQGPRGGDMARKIWLAGIGAYGRAFSDAQESLAKVTDDSARMFDELVAKGEEIEDTVEERGREIAKRVKAPASSIEERIKNMRARLNQSEGAHVDKLDAIEYRLSAIEEKLDLLLAETQKPAPTRRKTASKKKTT